MNVLKKSLLVSTALLLGMQETWGLPFPLGGDEIKDEGQTPKTLPSLPKMEELEAKKESPQTQFGEEITISIPPLVTAQIQHVGLERIAHDIIFHGLNLEREQREDFLQHHQIYPYIEEATQQFIHGALFGSLPGGYPASEEERKLTYKGRAEGFMTRASFYNVIGDGDCLPYVLGRPRKALIKDILKAGKKDTEEALILRNIFKIPIDLEKGRDCVEGVPVSKEEFKEFVTSFLKPKEYLPPEFAFAYGQIANKTVHLWKINPGEKTFQDYKDYIEGGPEALQPLHIGFVNGYHYQILIDEAAPDVGLQTAFAQAKEHKARQQWKRFLEGYDVEEDQLFLTEAEEGDIVSSFQGSEQTHREVQQPLKQQRKETQAALTMKKSKKLPIHETSDHNSTYLANETPTKLEEISRQILKIKENYKKIDSGEASKESLLHAIKESLLRISWRVEEIPSYDKFNMGTYFPEKNWLFLGYLSSILNSTTDEAQLESVLLALSNNISEIEEAIPIISKIVEKKELEEKEKVKIQLPSLEEIASFFMDTELLKKIKDSTSNFNFIKQKNSNENNAPEENTKRAVFRTFEIIGECAKYISSKLKECNTNIPWQPPSLDFLFSGMEHPISKGNILTTLRNKFHHDRDRLELIFQYEPQLLMSLLDDVIPFLHTEVTKLIEEREKAFKQLASTDFSTLNTSLVFKLKSELANNPNRPNEELKKLPVIRETLENIVKILIENEDEASSLSGRKIKELLSYINKDPHSIYKFLLKIEELPSTEEQFIGSVREKIDSQSFSLDIEQKFRKAYTKMKGKRVTDQQLEEALQQPPSKYLLLSIDEIKDEIREIILKGKTCNSQDFREKLLNSIFFKGIEQKEGEKRLELLRATVSVNASPREIEELFNLSEGDTQEIQEKSHNALASSNEVRAILQDISKLPKNKIGKKNILKLIGLSNEDRESLVEILSKEPPADPHSETVKKRFSNSLELKEKILKILKGEKVKIDRKNQLGQLINISIDDQNEVWKIICLPLEKKTKEENEKIEAILSKCPMSFAEYQPIYEEEFNRKFQGKQRSQEEVETAQRILEKLPTTKEAFDVLQQENTKKIKNILLKTEPIIQETNFDLLIETLYYTDSLVNKIRAKYRNILFQNSNLEESLNALLETMDESITPRSYLKTVLENGWLLPDELQEYFKELVAAAKLNWEDFQILYTKKKDNRVEEEDISEATKKLDNKITELNELNNTINNADQERADNTHRIKKINELKALIKNFMLKGEFDRTEEYFKNLADEAKLNWEEFQPLYIKKRDHLLIPQDINEAINQLNNKIRKLNEENNNINFTDKERLKNNQQIEKINNFKLAIKNIASLTEESFKKLVEKAGYAYSEKFKELYTTITYRGKSEPSLDQLKDGLFNVIEKLDNIFEELGEEPKVSDKYGILKMAAEYLIEEIGPAAEMLVNRPDYMESKHLSTSKRNLYLIAMCRKAMAHYPLSIDENLLSYLIDQLVLDARVRIDKSSNPNLEVFSEDVTFNKNRKITWEDVERKRTEIYAAVEGLGFKSNFKIFGSALGCDIGVQGSLNLLVESYDSAVEKNFQNLTELEVRLSRLLNGDVRVYTESTLAKRLSSKVDPKHQEEIKKQATYTLEDIIRGNSFVNIFRENRWASFRMPDGKTFTRSQFLEQQDLRKIFSFLICPNFSAEELEDLLSERENLQRVVKEKIALYNSSPNEYFQVLKDVFLPLSLVIPFYGTDFRAIYIPVRKIENNIHYKYFIPFGYIPQHRAFLSVEELPSQWGLTDFQNLPPFMQSLYTLVEQIDGSKIFIKCDEIFKEPLTRIERRELLPERLEENTARDIVNLLHNKRHRILETLSPQSLINATKIFSAITVDYAYSQKEFEEEQKNIESFRRARLEKNEELQNIIREKALKYKDALEKELSVLSGRMRECILKYVLLEKEIGGLLKNLYKQHKEDLTLLWEIMDEEQKMAISHLIEKGDTKILAPDIQNIISSFTHMSISAKRNLDFIKDNQIKEEVKNLLEEQKSIIQDIVKELFKQILPQSWQDNTQVISFKSGDVICYGFQFDRPRFVNTLNINPLQFSEAEAQRIADKYLAIFFAIRDPQVIRCFLSKEDPKLALYNDFCKRYCEKEEPSITFIADVQGSQEEYKLVDFSSEVEYTNYKRKEVKKQNLVEILEKVPSLPQSLKKLIVQGKEEKTRRNDEALLGFTGEAWEVYSQIAARGIEQAPEVPNLIVENLPSSISQINFSKIIISLRLETKSKTVFSNAIQDLDHLMQLYGWSEQGKEAYKAKNNFARNNEIIKEYFQFRRLIKVLEATTSQEHEYERKIADFDDRLKLQNYTVFQRARLSVDYEMYIQALEKNRQNKTILIEEITQHPYLQRKISEGLRDPNFLYALYNQSKEHPNSNEIMDNLIMNKKLALNEMALNELNEIK